MTIGIGDWYGTTTTSTVTIPTNAGTTTIGPVGMINQGVPFGPTYTTLPNYNPNWQVYPVPTPLSHETLLFNQLLAASLQGLRASGDKRSSKEIAKQAYSDAKELSEMLKRIESVTNALTKEEPSADWHATVTGSVGYAP